MDVRFTERTSPPIDHQAALGDVEEAREESDHRRLAGPGLPHEGNGVTRGDVEVDAAEHRASLAVLETDVLVANGSLDPRHLSGPGKVREVGIDVEQVEDAGAGGHGPLELA